jgi:hypothetical protein
VEEMPEALAWVQTFNKGSEFCVHHAIEGISKTRRIIVRDVVLYQKYHSRLRLITRMVIDAIMTETIFGLYAQIATH